MRHLSLALMLMAAPAWGADDILSSAPQLYSEHCAPCHGGDRWGAIGPALIPESLARMRGPEVEKVIAEGRTQTQMPSFNSILTSGQIRSLANFILGPLPAPPIWGMSEIEFSRQVFAKPDRLVNKPIHDADPLNLFTVVEAGDHHVTILDGDRFTPLARFESHFALHGGAKYSPDGRFVYFASRDGWVSKYDLWGLQSVAEVRVGINTRNIAVSADGKWLAAGNMLPRSLVILDATDLRPVKVIPAQDRQGNSSRISGVYTAPPRQSFIVALKDVKELWEISTDAKAGSALTFSVRAISTADVLDDFFFDPPYQHVMATARDGNPGEVIDLTNGSQVAELDLAGMPHLGSGIVFQKDGRWLMATPHLKEGKVSVIDMASWKTVKVIDTLGPGFFLRGHEASSYAWVDNSFSSAKDQVQVIDLRTLEIVKTLQPAPGKTTAHVEFTRDGRYALLSVMEMDGALIVYDATTLAEVKRIPMIKPNGKYNVGNKITYSAGTSH